MDFFNNLSLGYQIMLIGIAVFVIGVIIMMFENIGKKRSSKEIKDAYLIKNNVRTIENTEINKTPVINNNSNSNNTEINNNLSDTNNTSDLLNMYK